MEMRAWMRERALEMDSHHDCMELGLGLGLGLGLELGLGLGFVEEEEEEDEGEPLIVMGLECWISMAVVSFIRAGMDGFSSKVSFASCLPPSLLSL